MHHHIPSNCPNCSALLDGITPITDKDIKPKPGDVSICFECCEFLEFANDLTLKMLDLEKIDDCELLELHKLQVSCREFKVRDACNEKNN
jgi:hypothetical protein